MIGDHPTTTESYKGGGSDGESIPRRPHGDNLRNLTKRRNFPRRCTYSRRAPRLRVPLERSHPQMWYRLLGKICKKQPDPWGLDFSRALGDDFRRAAAGAPAVPGRRSPLRQAQGCARRD